MFPRLTLFLGIMDLAHTSNLGETSNMTYALLKMAVRYMAAIKAHNLN